MRSGIAKMSAVMLTALLLASALMIIPSTSAGDKVYGEYGAVYDFDNQDFEKAVKDATGKTFEEWIEGLAYFMLGYDMDIKPDVYSVFSTTRDTTLDGNIYNVVDHTSGYVKAKLDLTATGDFPDAGLYVRNQGESEVDFLKRIFSEGTTQSQIDIHSHIEIYVDLDMVSNVNMTTGDVIDSYITLKFAIYEHDDRNISFDYTTDEEGWIDSITLEYGHVVADSNLFLNIEVALTIDQMHIFSDETSWETGPAVTEHVNKFVISSDLANSLWLKAAKTMDGDKDSKLPELILELLGSGGRMLDLFDTIRSLTGSSVSDITFTDKFDAVNLTDARGYDYCRLTPKNSDGKVYDILLNTYSKVYDIPRDAYTLDYCQIVIDIPDSILDDSGKILLGIFFYAIGWSDIDVGDISHNQSMKDQCAYIRAYVDKMITDDDFESYSVPVPYATAAGIGIAVAAVMFLLVRRRLI